MIATEALVAIAACLLVLAAIGVRNAMSLKDIDTSLARLATALEARAKGAAGAGLAGRAPAAAPAEGRETGPSEAEIAAAIAAARRAAPGRD